METPWNPKAKAHLKHPSIGKGTTMGSANRGLAAKTIHDEVWTLPPSLHRVHHPSEFNLFLTSISQHESLRDSLLLHGSYDILFQKNAHLWVLVLALTLKYFPFLNST
jgi:hypothetical protein